MMERDRLDGAPRMRRPARSDERTTMHGRPVPPPLGVAPVVRSARRGAHRYDVAPGPVTHDGVVGAVEHVAVAPVAPDGTRGAMRAAWRPLDPHPADGANVYGRGAAHAARRSGQGALGAAERARRADAAEVERAQRVLVAKARRDAVAARPVAPVERTRRAPAPKAPTAPTATPTARPVDVAPRSTRRGAPAARRVRVG
jgi:hypothetical protein